MVLNDGTKLLGAAKDHHFVGLASVEDSGKAEGIFM